MRAPTSIELSCANPNSPCALPTGFNGDPDLKAVTARTFELGARGRLFGKVAWNAAVYDSRLRNDIQFIATSTTFGYFFNVGDTERRGVELGAQAQFGKLVAVGQLRLRGGGLSRPLHHRGRRGRGQRRPYPRHPRPARFKLRAGYAVAGQLPGRRRPDRRRRPVRPWQREQRRPRPARSPATQW